jgi:hypothetical protein
MSTLSDKIDADAAKPQSFSADGISVANRSLADQIAADKYGQANAAAASPAKALKTMFLKIVPPGAQ